MCFFVEFQGIMLHPSAEILLFSFCVSQDFVMLYIFISSQQQSEAEYYKLDAHILLKQEQEQQVTTTTTTTTTSNK